MPLIHIQNRNFYNQFKDLKNAARNADIIVEMLLLFEMTYTQLLAIKCKMIELKIMVKLY